MILGKRYKLWAEFELPDTVTEDDDEAAEEAEQEFEAAKQKTALATYSVISIGAVVFIEKI